MNIRAILRRRSFWNVLILCAVMALGIGRWGYTRWDDEWLRGQLVGTWRFEGDGYAPFDFEADGCGACFEKDLRRWWVDGGVAYLSEIPRPTTSPLLAYRIRRGADDSLSLEVGRLTLSSIDLKLFEIPLGRRFVPTERNPQWKLVRRTP